MTLPNFLVIGAPRSGTTALYNQLSEHPQIYMSPVKEPCYFEVAKDLGNNFKSPKTTKHSKPLGPHAPKRVPIWGTKIYSTLEDYEILFTGASDEKAIGEASTIYLYSKKAPLLIKKIIPDVKFVVILRNPVERAYSQFLHQVRGGYETVEDFESALELEDQRVQEDWPGFFHYVRVGFYFEQLTNYQKYFDKEQFFVRLHDDYLNNSEKLLRDLFNFLNVDESFLPDTSFQHNITGVPKNRFINRLFSEPHLNAIFRPLLTDKIKKILLTLRNKNLSKPGIPQVIRERLIQTFEPDISRLQDLLKRDLSMWLR